MQRRMSLPCCRGVRCGTCHTGRVPAVFPDHFAISQFFDRFLALTTVGYAFRGIQVCVVYLIASAGWKMVRKLPHRPLDNVILAIVLLAMLACSLLAVSFSSIYFILLSGTAGLCVYGVRQLRRGGGKP